MARSRHPATIGDTPHIRINRLFGAADRRLDPRARRNPRLDQGPHRAVDGRGAEGALGRTKAGGNDHRADSGNTGVAGDGRGGEGVSPALVMPDSMSHRAPAAWMLAYGAASKPAAREGNERLDRPRPRGSLAQKSRAVGSRKQFEENPANIGVARCDHRAETRRQTFRLASDALITGVGPWHITGCARPLKAMWPKLESVRRSDQRVAGDSGASQPRTDHTGIGAGFIPTDHLHNRSAQTE